MARDRLKIVGILEILKQTDKDNPITAQQIIEKLKQDYRIVTERKSVYKCIEELQTRPEYKIVQHSDKKKGWYSDKEEKFKNWEIKVLIDAIWQCRFLSQDVCRKITDKLKELIIQKSNQKLLTSVISTKTTLKANIEDIHENIEKILEAISRQVKIKFQYTDVDIDDNEKPVKVLRYGGFNYVVNPYFLVWKKEQYYLICNNDKYDDLSYYRVDRITNVQVLDEEKIKSINELLPNGTSDEIIGEFIDKSFYQFIGEKTRITIRCYRWMLEELVDYFGNDLIITKVEEEMIEISVSVRDGEGLFYWILQHGSNMEVISPIEIREEVKKRLKNTLKLYK